MEARFRSNSRDLAFYGYSMSVADPTRTMRVLPAGRGNRVRFAPPGLHASRIRDDLPTA